MCRWNGGGLLAVSDSISSGDGMLMPRSGDPKFALYVEPYKQPNNDGEMNLEQRPQVQSSSHNTQMPRFLINSTCFLRLNYTPKIYKPGI
jgi:hypothetical protein